MPEGKELLYMGVHINSITSVEHLTVKQFVHVERMKKGMQVVAVETNTNITLDGAYMALRGPSLKDFDHRDAHLVGVKVAAGCLCFILHITMAECGENEVDGR